jgi:hypothetical protein
MESNGPYRPRISRETRLLLTAGVMAIAFLWILARLRFQDLPVTPNPVPAVLGQFDQPPRYDDLAGEVVRLKGRIESSLVAFGSQAAAHRTGAAAARNVALRLREDAAVAWIPESLPVDNTDILARDPASGVTVLRTPVYGAASSPPIWNPQRPEDPRYVVTTDVSGQHVSVRPSFLASLDPISTALWSEALWALPQTSDVAAGSFVFTTNAELIGLVIEYRGGRLIVPGTTLVAAVNQLLQQPQTERGALGVDVQGLTTAVSLATGAANGVVVTRVDDASASKHALVTGDVIEELDGRPLTNRDQWDVHQARLIPGQSVAVRVRRRNRLHEIVLVAEPMPRSPEQQSLGLAMRARPGSGAEIVRVEPSTAAHRAGLVAGDVIDKAGEIHSPTPAQVARAFTSLRHGQHLLVVVTRGDANVVTAVRR